GSASQALAIVGPAAVVAVGAYAVQLGDPQRSVVPAALLGGVGWVLYSAATDVNQVDSAVATFVAAIAIGALRRLLARWQSAPARRVRRAGGPAAPPRPRAGPGDARRDRRGPGQRADRRDPHRLPHRRRRRDRRHLRGHDPDAP